MSVLVTGGAGYIGSHTTRALIAAGRRVVVLDSLATGHRDAVLGAPLVVGDIADRDLVARLCHEHDVTAAVHFAALKNVGESMTSPGTYWTTNVGGSAALADTLVTAGVRHIVFSSSCSVYGTPATVPVAEESPIHPESVYAETKAMVERILHWYHLTHGLNSVSLRYFNAAGASHDGRIGEDWTYSANLIPVVLKAALGRGREVEVFGTDYPTTDGTCIRDYVHVEDLADAHLAALDHLESVGGSFAVNVGTGVGSSVLDVITAVERISGLEVPRVLGPRRAGDPVATFADPTAAEKLLGWRARYGLDAIVATAHAWHASRPDGYATAPR